MSTKIHQENYLYFLNESEDLLRAIETELLNLREQRTQSKVYGLMRSTHTLKGAAAIVGQKTIQDLSHYLENVFQALLDPTVAIDAELETLLFQGYECLRLALAAEIRRDNYSLDNIKNQGAELFNQIQQKMGDALARENAIPSSAELGFDIVKSVFEVGVKEKLAIMVAVWETENPQQILDTFVPTAEIFVGLGESLKLPGFRAIATATLQALHLHPQEALTIAQIALMDLGTGYELVMEGDREQGGIPSPQLLELASAGTPKSNIPPQPSLVTSKPPKTQPSPGKKPPAAPVRPIQPPPVVSTAPASLTVVPTTPAKSPRASAQVSSPPPSEKLRPTPLQADISQAINSPINPPNNLSINPEDAALVELFGSDVFGNTEKNLNNNLEMALGTTYGDEATHLQEINSNLGMVREARQSKELAFLESEELLLSSLETSREPVTGTGFAPEVSQSGAQTTQPRQSGSKTLRVELEQLEQQNYLAGELLINQNQLHLQEEQRLETLQKLSGWLQQHRRTVNQLQKYLNRSHLLGELQDTLDTVLEETVQLEQATADLSLYSQNTQQFVDREQRLLKQVRESMQQTRMMPIGNILNRLALITQQLTSAYNKPVEIKVQGAEVLIDKAIAESLYESLLHLIRNAFAHGIESPEVRRQYQKPEVGTIKVTAYNQGNRTVIEVADDGAGLDVDRIFASAVSQNLLTPAQADNIKKLPQPEPQILDLLCSPGMSTRDDVDDLAGRGIGLNVVRSQIQNIRGNLTLQSQPHRGTTFFLRIKGALMSARLLSCRAGGKVYTFVANEITQTLMPFADQIKTIGDQKLLDWHDGEKLISIPLYQLTALFDGGISNSAGHQGLGTDSETIELTPLLTPRQGRVPVLLLPKGDGFIGLEVDQVIEEQELVIKPIPEAIPSPNYIYGCTVLADGNMTLVIDGVALIDYQDQANIQQVEESLGNFSGEEPPPLLARVATKTIILIVDDSITERQKLSLVLQKSGYQVQQAKDGVEALEQLQKNPAIPLVICDLEMPRMNGFEFLSITRQQPKLAKIPVVMLTSRGSNQYRQIASSLGAIAYFTKPYLDYQLVSKVKEILEQ